MKLIFLLIAICQIPNIFGFPIEAEIPKTDNVNKPTMYIAIDTDDFSKQLDMELNKEWRKARFPDRDKSKQTTEQYNADSGSFYNLKYEMIRLNKNIRSRINIEMVYERSELPYKCPAFRIGKNSEWETFHNRAFIQYTYPLKTVLSEIDRWYIYDWRKALEDRRTAEYTRISNLNSGLFDINLSILESKYGKIITAEADIQVTAIYRFNGKTWDKIATPDKDKLFIPDNVVVSVEAQNKQYKLHKVLGYINGYKIRNDIYSLSAKIVPIDGLNCRLMPQVFPSVELLPNPPWEQKYSFVPF